MKLFKRRKAKLQHYFSTACLHNSHKMCRNVCKYCEEKCKCTCHNEES